MEDKTKRLSAINRLITGQRIHSQEELLILLVNEGFHITQATLSRDLKFLKIGRKSDEDGNRYYILPNNQESETPPPQPLLSQLDYLSLEFSGNLGVIKTYPGFAGSIASIIDSFAVYEILGTIAGDDTILLVLRENVSPLTIKEMLNLKMNQIRESK
ncbi:MAG: hypothetical protein MJB14_07875 [Spirochaetes bacterium]|nr:hypothetical protein [Spirochaetota bacterium]